MLDGFLETNYNIQSNENIPIEIIFILGTVLIDLFELSRLQYLIKSLWNDFQNRTLCESIYSNSPDYDESYQKFFVDIDFIFEYYLNGINPLENIDILFKITQRGN